MEKNTKNVAAGIPISHHIAKMQIGGTFGLWTQDGRILRLRYDGPEDLGLHVVDLSKPLPDGKFEQLGVWNFDGARLLEPDYFSREAFPGT